MSDPEKDGVMEVINDSLKGRSLTIQQYTIDSQINDIYLKIKKCIASDTRKVEIVVDAVTGIIKRFQWVQ